MFFNKLHTYVSTLMTLCMVKVLEMTMYFLENLLGKKPLELPSVFCILNWDSCQILHTIKFTWAFFKTLFADISKTAKSKKTLVEIRRGSGYHMNSETGRK